MRGKPAPKRTIAPDPKYNSVNIAKFVNMIMRRGKKTTAQEIVYDSFNIILEKSKKNPLETFDLAVKNVSPEVEVKSRRIGGGNYQIPMAVVGATTKEEYLKFIKKDATLDRRLHPILVDEPTPAETLEILKGIRKRYEDYHKVKISDEAIQEAVDLAVKNIKDKFFPDKAIDLIDEASSMVSLAKAEGDIKDNIPTVTPEHIRKILKEMQHEKI